MCLRETHWSTIALGLSVWEAARYLITSIEMLIKTVILLALYNLFIQRRKKKAFYCQHMKITAVLGHKIPSAIKSYICFSLVVYFCYFQAILSQVFRDTLYGNQNPPLSWSLAKWSIQQLLGHIWPNKRSINYILFTRTKHLCVCLFSFM